MGQLLWERFGKKETAYSVAKNAVIQFTHCLATQLRPDGITVNCIAPVGTRTGRFLATLKNLIKHDLDRMKSKGPLERVANLMMYQNWLRVFMSPMSDFVSGQVLGEMVVNSQAQYNNS